jgi:site-specific recombinase XerD
MSEQFSFHCPLSTEGNKIVYETIFCHFSDHLEARGHSNSTQRAYQSALRHFVRWFTEESSKNWAINSRSVCTFLYEHLPVCNCSPPVFKEPKTIRAALNQLLLMLGYERLLPRVSKGSVAIECSLHQFDDYLRNVCGLTKSTRLSRQRQVRPFLVEIFGSGPINPMNITSELLFEFVTNKATGLKPSSVGVLLGALRSYLRYLQFKGESNVTLIASIPRPPNWSLASLPPSLSDADMKRFWAAFNSSTPIGKRDYAMARCLADLGMRCHEVVSMQIGDIDWRSGIIQLHHNKSRREELLPLPDITGRAVVDYLRNGRPVTPSRSIFVFHRAPTGRGVAGTTVRGAVRRAFLHAGLPWTGTHILRHTAAAQMVKGGASIKEIADVLRHHCIDTTQIYTKVNLPELKNVAMPWPGRQS